MSASTGKGRVARVIGPVVDIEFPADSMPAIFNALHVEVTMSGTTRTLTMEVAQHIGCLLYTSPSPRDVEESRMPSSA